MTVAHINEGSPAKHALHLHILQDVAYTDWDGLGAALAHLACCACGNITFVKSSTSKQQIGGNITGQPIEHQRLVCCTVLFLPSWWRFTDTKVSARFYLLACIDADKMRAVLQFSFSPA